jgi:hypothetical protein
MGILRNRRVFGRALVSTLAFAVSVGLLALWETGRGTVLSAGTDTCAPEFAYSGDNEPGFCGETPGWEACAGTARTQRQSPIDIDHIIFDRHLGPLQLRLHETPLALPNNGHTIEEEYEPGSSLTVNGVGWNFLFVGATTLVTTCYRPNERGKAQALNDLLVFSTTATSSFMAGFLQDRWGWQPLNWLSVVLMLAAAVAVIWLRYQRPSLGPAH